MEMTMSNKSRKKWSCASKLALAALVLAALPLALARTPGEGAALAQSRAAAPDFEMAAQEGPFRSVADAFMTAAAAGNAAGAERLISPTAAAKAGQEGIERFLASDVLPFFAQFKEVARSVTVTRTANVTGFAFYMYMVTKSDELRPFVIYVIEEGGAKVVANVLVDHLVEGRHCLKVAAGWKCPDFG
jgi:hypothetical protein